MKRAICYSVLVGSLMVTTTAQTAPTPVPAKVPAAATPAAPVPVVAWQTDYAKAMELAKTQRKMLLVCFETPGKNAASTRFEREVQRNARLVKLLDRHVALRLPMDAKIMVQGKETVLIQHPAYGELNHQQGVVILDFAHTGTETYGHVVSVLPFGNSKYYRFRPDHLAVLLDLPAGTLTQRTMIFAVRIHPEAPASTLGEADRNLLTEARSHSRFQARLRSQGHHNWGGRFQRLSALLPGGLRAQEVVAESWPGEGLVDACVDCVDSWRQSSGHWSAVRSRQPRFAYDIQRGSNGIWYATGLFGNRH
jgi:hypothetical protein